jgi:hypothetical protein
MYWTEAWLYGRGRGRGGEKRRKNEWAHGFFKAAAV